MPIFEADSIRYDIKGRQLLSDIYLKLETGKVTALIGRNGVGKSTLFKIIYGELNTEDRSVRVDGKYLGPKIYKVPNVLGFLPQKNFIPKHLKIKNLFSIYDLNMSDCFADFPELAKCVNSTFGNLSGGEARLFEIYFIVKSPFQFVILDEPFTLISPIYIERLKALFAKEKANKGILLSDHMIHDVMEVCDDLYLLANGVLKKTTIEQVKNSYLTIQKS
ncbi:ATP-binding cassette domain-containing protein [Chitinophaga sp.]|uniref:ATP-binding cassette domain-containing protein n=1 Tax=Chitinophaga sp. TaxID=1869181 RepID=UPI0031D9A62C